MQDDIWEIYRMNTWEDVGGSDLWLKKVLSGGTALDQWYQVYHCSELKGEQDKKGATWYYAGCYDWTTFGLPKAKAKKAKAKARNAKTQNAKAQAKTKGGVANTR